MKKNLIIIILIVVIIIQAHFLFTTISNFNDYQKISDSLELEIQYLVSRKDSIIERIDSIYITIERNNYEYEEITNNIINNDASEDLDFFYDYINRNKARLDSLYILRRP